MKGLNGLSSECVCGRRFSWRRILEPDLAKEDPQNWIVSFGPGVGDPQWDAWCKLISAELFNRDSWCVLLVTSESPQLQLAKAIYTERDCRYVRSLSDETGRVGKAFGVDLVDSLYPFSVAYVQGGQIIQKASFAPG